MWISEVLNVVNEEKSDRAPEGWSTTREVLLITERFLKFGWSLERNAWERNGLADAVASFTASNKTFLCCDELRGTLPQSCLDYALRDQLAAGL